MMGQKKIYRIIKATMFMLLAVGGMFCAFPTQAQYNNNWGYTGIQTPTFNWGNIVRTDQGSVTNIKNIGSGSSVYKPEPSDTGPSTPFSDKTKNNEKDGILSSFGEFVSDAAGAIKNGLDSVGDAVKSGWEAIGNAAQSVMNLAVEEAKKLLGYSNYSCRQDRMNKIYLNGCYSCTVIRELISAFLNGCAHLESVSKDAGKKILILGFILWIVFYVLKQISSWKNIEPAAMVNDMLIMAFKVLGAWVVIAAGYELCVDFVLVPFLQWGVDFGNTLLASIASASGVNMGGQPVETVSGPQGFLPASFLNELVKYVSAINEVTIQHMKLGHMIMCHSCHAGKWVIIPNLWLMLCGFAIWMAGLMMALAVMFYIVDMSFKLSIALIALPIVVGLWPFGITRDRFGACIKIILNAAGIFVFLAMTASVGLAVVAKAIDVGTAVDGIGGGLQTLFTAVDEGNADLVADSLAFWSAPLLLMLFAYLFAIKTIGSTMNDYVDPFFSSIVGGLSPMHHKLTQQLDLAKQKVTGVASLGYDIVRTQTSLGLSKTAQKLAGRKDGENDKDLTDKVGDFSKRMENLSKGKQFQPQEEEKEKSKLDTAKKTANLEAKDDKKITEQTTGTKSDSASGGSSTSASQQAMEAAGEGLTAAGEAVKQGAEAASQGVNAAGQGAAALGDAAAPVTFGVSAAVGHGAQAGAEASAAAIKVSGKVAGEAMKQTGKALKKSAKVAGKVEKGIKKAAKAAKKAGKTAEKAKKRLDQEMKNNKNNKNQNNNNNENTQAPQQQQSTHSNDAVENMMDSITGSKK